MTDAGHNEGLTRRRFLGRAAAGVAGLALAGATFRALSNSLTEASVPYATGYNDDFWKYATADVPDPALPFAQVKAGSGQYIRQMIDWRLVQPSPSSPLNFSHYDRLRDIAKDEGLKVLPHFVNCCPEFRDPASTGGERCDRATDQGCIDYPSPANYERYGAFVAAGMGYFDEVADTAEIWNEPNIDDFGALPPNVFASLVRASCDWLAHYEALGNVVYSRGPKRVVAGGLAGSDPDFLGYLQEYLAAVPDRTFDVGLHSYDFHWYADDRPGYGRPWTSDEAADEVAKTILTRVSDVTRYLRDGQRVWLTETGVSAREPIGREGQARALGQIAQDLRSEPRCAAMIVHRLYPNPNDPQEQSENGPFFETGVFDQPYGTAQPAYAELAVAWTLVSGEAPGATASRAASL